MNVLGINIERGKCNQTEEVANLCRQKLLGYSESFRELAKSFDDRFETKGESRQSMLEERKSWENRRVICDNLKGVAQVMSKVAREELRYEPLVGKDRRVLVHALREEGICADCLCDVPTDNGRLAVGMTLYTPRRGERPASEVADMLSVLLGRQMQVSAVSPYLVDRKKRTFYFLEQAKYIALTGFARAVRENELVSGDNYAFLESEKGKMTILLSDGTGSGEKANRDSERVLDLMEKMLEAGYDSEEAVNLINSALFAKEEDSNHPTIDICNLDLYLGKCRFLKVGGAVSYLKREQKAEEIKMGNLPLGIFQNIEVQSISKTLQNGDYLILMTDGVLDAFGEEDYEEPLAQVIGELTEQNPGELAEKLLHLAIHRSEGHIYDDMTILVIGIWENSCIT